ncbi:MAG: beta-ketoacyl-ACP synthase II [Bacteroidales bacterium]|jgi:3-oxoacyl-[acyl-carrier-protein] synthase II|nr:beta-ketoacyl-ACP synthase II [Bacteroidales bacterium]MDY0253759.1 beta-ketoacyl-ACP synthase II [Tenuifilaceae bacterium]
MELKRVVVTGLGTLNPIGNNINEYWKNLEQGVSGADMITSFDTSKFKTKFACQVKNFDALQHFDRKELRKYDPYCQFGMVAAHEAFLDSGLDLEKIDHDAAGVVWASGIGGIQTFMEEMRGYFAGDGTPRFSPFFIPRMIADIASGHISIRYGFRGPNYTTVSACASSTHALIDALNLIRLGQATIMLTGGSEASVNEAGMGGFNAMQAISTNNEEYKTASRPFDVTRDGFVMGEGAGALILEEYEHAKARGAKIYAELAGGGMTADAHHFTAPHPDGLGAKNVMINALKNANLKLEDVDYINVHGTATPLGDIAEIKAITSVFGEHAYKLSISSTKSMTGHLLGATGAIEAIAAIFAINKGIIPPTINHANPDPEIDPKVDLTLNKAKKREVNVALSNTFGFGGHNSSVVFKKFVE